MASEVLCESSTDDERALAATSRPISRSATAPEAASRTVIEPPRKFELVNLAELWQFRELLFFLTWRDVKVRYKQTVLGAAWAVLQPTMMMVVFTVFFARMARVPAGDLPYPLFAYAGCCPGRSFRQLSRRLHKASSAPSG
jgi:lipopolysaccharide transport system permease protein